MYISPENYYWHPNFKFPTFETQINNLKSKSMKQVRAKFNITATKNEDGSMTLSGSPVVTGCEENKSFADATPSGSINLHISKDMPAQELFADAKGKEFYLDITPCEAAPAQTTSNEA